MEEKLKILVVDDDKMDRMAVRLALTESGVDMELYEVIDGNNALFAVQNTNFDCVFLDYCLPNEDSLTLINKLRSYEIKIPLIILSDEGEEKIAVELLEAGATNYVIKSQINSENLVFVLRNTIRLYQAEIKADFAYQQLKESHEQLIHKNQQLEKQRQQIKLQNLKLLAVSKLKSQFLATISHELRTPMNAIIGFSQILLRPKLGQLSNQQTDMVQRILNNAKHLLMLLNEVLDFSKLESGKLELKPEICDLSNIVNNTIMEIRSLAQAKNLSLLVKIELENNLVFNDPLRIHQILINLLSNAVKFTEYGSIKILVTEISTNRINIIVRDTGIGICHQDFQQIFEAFQQLDQSISRKYSGTGLGLAIIDSLVKMMGGKIFLESQLGVGSEFKIELPREIELTDNNDKCGEGNFSLNLDREEEINYLENNLENNFDQKLPHQSYELHKVVLEYPHRKL